MLSIFRISFKPSSFRLSLPDKYFQNFKFSSIRDRTKKYEEHIPPIGYFLLTIPVLTFGLGAWQVKRRRWKLNLIKDLEEKTSKPPIPFPFDLESLKDIEYQRVIVQGKFDHSKEICLSPRSLVVERKGGVFSRNDQSGAWVITPFQLADKDLTILINRGWVPRNKTNPLTRIGGQISDEVELVAVVRKTEVRAPFVPKNDPSKGFWYFRDVVAMAEYLNTAPVFLDADSDSSIPGGPIGGQTRISLRNEHFSYILTWYSLSLITAYMWHRQFIRKLPLH